METYVKNSPSALRYRIPVIIFALIGFVLSLYLALFEAGWLKSVWDPFFGEGSVNVLHSSFTRGLPLPDAAMGAWAYCLEAVAASLGGEDRWRRRHWIVFFYGAIATLLGLTGIALVFVQIFVVHSLCTLCLCSAAISLGLMTPALHEFAAAFHHWKEFDGGRYSPA